MNKRIILPLFCAFLMTGCAKASAVAKAEEPAFSPDPIELEDPDPDLKTLLTNQNNKGYTKKTTIADAVCEHADYFHANCNGSQRATYYNEAETALLMGNYDGTFNPINSGYRNLAGDEEGIQHFTYKGEGDYFTDVKDDWSFMGQSVGKYYPTLTSLSNLINQEEDWEYKDEVFTYTKDNASLLKNFQFFAAPMLLEGKVELKTIKIKLVGQELSIELIAKDNSIVSTAKVT
jgi:hypothetical protein